MVPRNRSVKHKLRPIIIDLIASYTTPDLGVAELQNLIDQKQSLLFRLLWFLIVKLCFCICCYQIAESVKLLLSYPVAVDINLNELTSSYIPVITLCSAENNYLLSHLGRADNVYECTFPMTTLLKKENLNYNELWNYEDSSLAYKSHEFLNNIVIENITIDREKMFLGQCTVFGDARRLDGKLVRTSIAIHIKKGKLCDQSITLVSVRDKIDFRLVFLSLSGTSFHATFAKRNYMFLNTPRQACSSIREYEICYRKCFEKQILKRVNCRLPYFPSTINIPFCSNASDALQTNNIVSNFYTSPTMLNDCGCTRTCNNELYTIFPTTVPWFENESIFIMTLDQTDVGFNEYLAYETSDLLTDIGGNLGLFLGLSIVAILNIIFVTVTTIIKRYSRKKTAASPHISAICKEVYQKELNIKLSRISTRPKQNPALKILHIVVAIACACLAIFMIQERIKYYLREPVRYIVEVKERQKITFPSYTICGVSEKIALYKRNYAKANNISDWCEIDMFDMLRGKGSKKLSLLWSKSETQLATNTKYLLETATGIPAIDPNYTKISTHLGLCSHLKFKEETYSGVFTVYLAAYANTVLHVCRENYYIIFYDDLFSDTYNILTRIEAPLPGLMMVDYRLTKIKRINTKRRACVQKSHFKQCKEKCMKEQLQNADNLCDLPFLSSLVNLTKCSTPEMAKKTREEYVKILTGVTVGTACSCVNPCTENVFTMSEISILQPPGGPFIISFLMTSNIEENIIEVEKYSIVALFSDIGNSLGLAVGFSVLTAALYLHQMFSFLRLVFTKTHTH